MAGIQKRRSARRKKTEEAVNPNTNKARNRRLNRHYGLEAMTLMKDVSSRIFSVRNERSTDGSEDRRGERRIRSDSFVRTRPPRKDAGMPPVVARRGLQDMATPKHGARMPRKRRDIGLKVPGAEVRLPSLPAVGFGPRLLSGLFLVMMVLAGYLLLNSSTFQVDLVEVEGLERLTLADIDQVLGIAGEPVVSLDSSEIRQALLSHFHGIQDVRVVVGLPASVQLTVRERQPVMAWVYEGGTRWVDDTGITFEPGSDEAQLPLTVQSETLPVLPGSETTETEPLTESQYDRLDSNLVHVIQTMSNYLPAGAVLAYDANNGLGWADERGWQVYFGDSLNDIDQKLIVYQSIVDKLEADGIQPSLISVEYLHAPFYRMEH